MNGSREREPLRTSASADTARNARPPWLHPGDWPTPRSLPRAQVHPASQPAPADPFGGYGLPDWLAASVISVPVIEQRTKEFFRQLET